MRGKEYNAVVYSEYSGDIDISEKDRCYVHNVGKKGLKDFTYGLWQKLEKQEKEDIRRIFAVNPNIYKGEKNLLKIIVKNKETRIQKCVDIPKERENDSDIKGLRVGMTVFYLEKMGMKPKIGEIVKIVDNRPKGREFASHIPPYYNPWRYYCRGRGIGLTTAMGESINKFGEARKREAEERVEVAKYKDKKYFNVKLDPIKGKPEGKENLEKIKFPCWIVYQRREGARHEIGMLVTGYPGSKLEYQLINMMEQVDGNLVCTIFRDTDLKKLMGRLYSIEVVKGESQLWKVGKVDV